MLVAEAEPAQDGGGMVAPGVAAGVLEPRLSLRVPTHRRGAVLAARHRLLEAAELVLDGDEIRGSGEDVFA